MIRSVAPFLVIVATLVSFGAVAAQPLAPVLDRPSIPTRLLPHIVLEDVALVGSRLVAVGEHGIIMLSDDSGQTWTQSEVPVSVTLTAVSFPDTKHGFAVGHGGVVLGTDDGGSTWTRRLDGLEMPGIVARDGRRPSTARLARQLAKDGPDKPLLALHFRDANHGIVVGADGLVFATEDGGRHWTSWADRVIDPKSLHFYSIVVDGEHILLAGEQGLLERSDDAGRTFTRLRSPVRASYFAAYQVAGQLIIAGLRGHVFISADCGQHFTTLAVPNTTSIAAVVAASTDTLLVLTQNGQVWTYSLHDHSVRVTSTVLHQAPASAVVLKDGALMTVGSAGVETVQSSISRDKG